MSIKRMSLRFNLDNESDRKAWEHLQSIPASKNKAVIDALNASFEQANALADRIFHLRRKNRRYPKTRRRFSMQWMPLWAIDGMKVMPLYPL